MEVLGVLCLMAAGGFALLLPPSKNFTKTSHAGLGFHVQTWLGHLKNPALQKVYMLGFCLTGVFSTVYNYLSFRLFEPPYNMSPFTVSLMFLLFLFGTVASSYTGALTMRFGAKRLLLFLFRTDLCRCSDHPAGLALFHLRGHCLYHGWLLYRAIRWRAVWSGYQPRATRGMPPRSICYFTIWARALWAMSADGSGIGASGRGLPRSPVFWPWRRWLFPHG